MKWKLMQVVLISKKIQSFQPHQILELIPPEVLSDIKSKDQHPFFQMYSMCNEGTYNPKRLGDTDQRPITWTRKAIQSIKNIALKGLKLFKGHNEDNSTEKREDVGEIIHSFEKEVDGELNHLIITYHPPEKRDEAKDLDVVSHEGEWNIFESAGRTIAGSVKAITGIALGKSNNYIPAFSGAKRLGMIQAFEKSEKGEKMAFTSFEEWKNGKNEFHVHPNHLFTVEEMKSDKVFGKIFEENEIFKAEAEKLHNQVKTLQEGHEKEKLTFAEEVKKLQKQSQMATVSERIEKLHEGLTPEMKKFINVRFSKEKEHLENYEDETLKKYIEKQKEVYQDFNNLNENGTEKNTDNKQKEKKDTSDSFVSEDLLADMLELQQTL